jgi:type VI secretion system secreted protein VgrG
MDIGNFSLDVLSFLRIATILAFIFSGFSILSGVRLIQSAGGMPYFRMRRQRKLNGWRRLVIGFSLTVVGLSLILWGEPAAYSMLPLTATPSLTPTKTISPTITLTSTVTFTPTISLTPEVSNTPTTTLTPHIPIAVEAQFESSITPNPESVFSPLEFSEKLDALYRPVSAKTEFENPIQGMYAVFSYDNMALGSQWTALWYRNGELVYYETKPWIDGTGGVGFTDWQPEQQEWLPGTYQVQIFVGADWKVVGEFVLFGDPPTPLPPPSMTPTSTLTPTVTPSRTRVPTNTKTIKPTPWPTLTWTITWTPWPTITQTKSPTPPSE